MIYLQVTYRIRSERMKEAERKIGVFAEALRKGSPRFLTYHLFRHGDDDRSFVHYMSFRNQEDQLAHIQLPHVKQFVESMLDLCEQGPIYAELHEITAIGPGTA